MSQPHGSTSGPKRRKGQRKATTTWNQFFNENGIYYSLVLAFAAALVVALIKAVEYVDLRPLGPPDFVDAPSFESALVASVGVCGPIVLELIQDASFVAVSMVSKRAVFVGKLRYFIGRSILLIGLLVPSCFLLLQMQLGNPYGNRAELFICAVFIRRILFLSAVLFCMAPVGDTTFTPLRTFSVMACYVTSQLIEIFNINAGTDARNTAMQAFSTIFLVLTYAAFAFLVLLWASKKWARLVALFHGETLVDAKAAGGKNGVKTAKSAAKVVPEEFYELGILVLALLGCIAGHVVDGQHSWNGSTEWGNVSSSLKTGYTYLAIIYTSFMSALLGRHARVAVIIEKENTIDQKRAFVRYISHEIRTPLNTVCLGLNVLSDDLKASSNPQDKERYETIEDIAASCQVALSILNDLLNIDKLESGTLILERKLEPVLPFISDSLNAFKLQAEKQGVRLILDHEAESLLMGQASSASAPVVDVEAGLPPTGGSGGVGPRAASGVAKPLSRATATLALGDSVVADDCMNIDVHKFGQVVRNLLSNALKFTKKENGTVTVRVRVVTDFTLTGLVETEEFKHFGRKSVWELLMAAKVERDMTSAAASRNDSHHSSSVARLRLSRADLSKAPTATPRLSSITPRLPGATPRQVSARKLSVGDDKLGSIAEGEDEAVLVDSDIGGGPGPAAAVTRGSFAASTSPAPLGVLDTARRMSGTFSGHLVASLSYFASDFAAKADVDREKANGTGDEHNGEAVAAAEPGSNSSDPSPRGSVDGHSTRMLVVEVIDTGVGMSAEFLPRIFNEVLQINPGELQAGGGSGLGLMLTKGIVEQHGGKISVYSAGINTGCTFTVLLPVFKRGNVKVEAMNREEASSVSRRVFINKFLAGGKGHGDLDLVPHGNFKKKQRPSAPDGPAFAGTVPGSGDGDEEKANGNGTVRTSGKAGAAFIPAIANALKRVAGRGDSDDESESDHSSVHSRRTLGYEDADPTATEHDNQGPLLDPIEEIDNGSLHALTTSIKSPPPTLQPNTVTLKERLLGLSQLYILVVDDSALNRKMLVKLLAGRGHRCDEAKHGLDAVKKMSALRVDQLRAIEKQQQSAEAAGAPAQDPFSENVYDVVLLDYIMPVMDGPTAAVEMRKLGYNGIIVGVTGNALANDVDHFVGHGVNCVLTKPLDMVELNTAIKTFAGTLQ